MTLITKYRIFCLTEERWIEGWGESPPTKCYNNHSHIINISSIQELELLEDNLIKIKEENIKTGGNIQIDMHTFDIPNGVSGDITIYEASYPHPINLLSFTVCPTNINIGDYISADIGHNKTIGTLTSDLSLGVTELNVSQTVIDVLNIGYLVHLDTGVTSADLGRCLSIDKFNLRITTEFSTDIDFLSGSYVQQTVQTIRKMRIPESPSPIKLGDTKIGASYIPTNIPGRIKYTNNDGNSKKFMFYIEYLY